MQIQIPRHVARALRVNELDEMEAVVQGVQLLDREVGPLLTDGAKTAFNELLQHLPNSAIVEIGEAPAEIAGWRYRIVEFDGAPCARVVEIPVSARSTSTTAAMPPPTDAEPMLVQAWLASDKLTDEDERLRANIVVFEWLAGVTEAAKSVVRALSGVMPQRNPTSAPRSWTSAGLVALRGSSRLLSHKDSELLRRLFTECATELAPRWRFLSLYRILEHGYLENVFVDLSSRFFSEPREALDSATNALKSEVEQFVRLVDGHGLKQYFEEIARVNDVLAAAGNQFSILVEREAKRKSTNQENFKRGVAVCYQIRCSIVHAGSHSVIFDKSPGGDDALLAHLGELEKAVAQFLGVQAT